MTPIQDAANMAAGFDAALEITEGIVNGKPMFAPPVLAAQAGQEPVAQIVFDELWEDNKLIEKRRPQIFPQVDLMRFEQGTKLYAAPPQDTLDAKQAVPYKNGLLTACSPPAAPRARRNRRTRLIGSRKL